MIDASGYAFLRAKALGEKHARRRDERLFWLLIALSLAAVLL